MSNDWIETFTGLKMYPLAPKAVQIEIADIAHALAYKCRFNGHCRAFYSVAEHSIRMYWHATTPLNKMLALLHDSAEAYLPDIPRPIKPHYPKVNKIENRLLSIILTKYIGCPELTPYISLLDAKMLATEARDLMSSGGSDWQELPPPYPEKIKPLRPEIAEKLFLFLFYRGKNSLLLAEEADGGA